MDKNELKQLNDILKDIPKEKRASVRRMISADISFDDAMTVCRAFLPIEVVENTPDGIKPRKTSDKGVKSQNKTIDDIQADIVPQNDENSPKNDLQRVDDAGALDMQEIEAKINAVIDNFCEINDIDDMRKAPQSLWNAFCIYSGKHIFKGTDILKTKEKKYAGCALTTCGAYDIEKCVTVLNYFVYMVNLYCKVFTYWTAAAFLGVDADFLNDHAEELTRLGFRYVEKSEQSLTDAISDGKRNPTGCIAILNAKHGWNTAHTTHTEKKETIVMYPVLGNITSNNTPMIENN